VNHSRAPAWWAAHRRGDGVKTSLRTVCVRTSAPFAVADLTGHLLLAITESRITDGSAIAFCAHTTCTLLIKKTRKEPSSI
jgi:thiamine phosphate synthase YjbQ (UPF0047 family)